VSLETLSSSITVNEDAVFLEFTEFATGNALDGTGFNLGPLLSDPELVPGDLTVAFLGDFSSFPLTAPFISEDGSEIQWTTLVGMDPRAGAVARIGLQFVPEPGTALLMGLGLAGLGVAGRKQRDESEGTA